MNMYSGMASAWSSAILVHVYDLLSLICIICILLYIHSNVMGK